MIAAGPDITAAATSAKHMGTPTQKKLGRVVRFFFIGISHGRGAGVGRGEPVGVGGGVRRGGRVGRGAGVGRGLGEGVRHGQGERVEVGVAVNVGVGVTLTVTVAVGVGRGCWTSNEPISRRPFLTRSYPGPRWSSSGGPTKFGSPALIAGLPGNSACVSVGPPLSCKGLSIGSVLI